MWLNFRRWKKIIVTTTQSKLAKLGEVAIDNAMINLRETGQVIEVIETKIRKAINWSEYKEQKKKRVTKRDAPEAEACEKH